MPFLIRQMQIHDVVVPDLIKDRMYLVDTWELTKKNNPKRQKPTNTRKLQIVDIILLLHKQFT